ncbi:hypothetical protein F5I97DRAFT_88314 [Phlebopus sp. FC_14]|nr:hypothetical protein F5I97DRAFT_88314 [Phlebopus sp. FC_14]
MCENSPSPVQIEGPFITTLYQVLNEDSWQRIIAWCNAGTRYLVTRMPSPITRTEACVYVKQEYVDGQGGSNQCIQFAEFVRMLGTYGFRMSVRTLRFQNSSFTTEGWEFCHPDFRSTSIPTSPVLGRVILPFDLERSIEFSVEVAHLLATARDEVSDLRHKVAHLAQTPDPSAVASSGSPTVNQTQSLDDANDDERILLFNGGKQDQIADRSVQVFNSPPPISPIGPLALSLDLIDSERRKSPQLKVLPPDSPEPSHSTFPSSLPSTSHLKTTTDYAPSPPRSSSVPPSSRTAPSSFSSSSTWCPRGRTLSRNTPMSPSLFGEEGVPSERGSSSSPSRSPFLTHLSNLRVASSVTGSDHGGDPTLEGFDEPTIISSPDVIDPEYVRAHIRELVSKTLEGLPTRLINTEDGQLYTRASLHTAFDISEQCHHLTSLIHTQNLVHNDFVKEVIQTYFQYAMLSHRWEHSGEPLLSDFSTSIFDQEKDPRFFKLQMYCRTARQRGMKWAWCDTCCINKESSSELEEAVTSMFRWYRNSALTIVYLSDVSGFSHRTLTKSQWFTRGWTLQELLAPRVMQFYDKTWTPCVKGSHYNHKNVPDWMESLEKVTGIPVKALRDYVPGTDNPREKLRWAASRTTTRVEDVGYCLIGIFDVTLTPHYGEEDKAFERLLLKIMKATHDISLLDWVGKGSTRSSFIPTHPNGFRYPPLIDVQPQSSTSQSNSSSPSSSFATPTGIISGLFASPSKGMKHCPDPYSITEPTIDIYCFIHKVDVKNGYSRITLPEDDSGREHRKSISYTVYGADDLAEFVVVVKDRDALEAFPTYRLPFVVARVWDPVLYESSSDSNKMKPHKKFREFLMKPFIALLLVEGSESGVYRRIPTADRVVARLAKAPKSDYQAISVRVA